MVVSDIPAGLRILVATRADNRCEYCLISQSVSLYKHEPDHIIPRQHGGQTSADNLALACLRCNRSKGPNIGSIDPLTHRLVPFYNPRTQEWADHFKLEGALIYPLTPEARVTVKILRLNDEDRVMERQELLDAGFHG